MPSSPRRRTAVVLSLALLACLTGMALAVVAFGQGAGDLDATIPLGDYTGTTPARQAQATTPTGGYTTTTPTSSYTTPTSSYTTTTPATHTVTAPSSPGSSGGGPTTGVPVSASHLPRHTAHVSKVTRPGPSHLAFTGGEPLLVGGAGAGLMLAAMALQLRRRRGGAAA